MPSIARSRIVLLTSLVALGTGLAAFLSVTGVTSAVAADTSYEFEIRDDALVTSTDGTEPVRLIEDVRRTERIEVTIVDGRVIVSSEPRAPPTLNATQRRAAKRIVTAHRSIVDRAGAADGAVYTIRPVLRDTSSERAAVDGLSSVGPDREPVPAPSADPAFTVRENATESRRALVFEREGRSISTDRALVVIDVIGADLRYSAVVDLDSGAIEALVRFEPEGASDRIRT